MIVAQDFAIAAPSNPVPQPFLGYDLAEVARMIGSQTEPDQIAKLLASDSSKLVKAAVIGLGLHGGARHANFLLPLLRSGDETVASLAEDALWAIWMRAGSETGNSELALAVRDIKSDDFAGAISRLEALCETEPDFAEAHHQRAIAANLLERYDDAADAYRAALRLNPNHFAAAAGLGQIAAERGDLPSALEFYRQANQLHPHLEGVAEAIELLRAAMRRRGATPDHA